MAREGFKKGEGESVERAEGRHRPVAIPVDFLLAMDSEEERFPVTLYVLMAALCLDLLKSRQDYFA